MQPATAAIAYDKLTDPELAQRIATGDKHAFELLMRRYNQKLYRTARSILKDDAEAEDAVQEAYLLAAPADDTVRLTGLQTGRFNWIQTVPPQRIGELERARDLKSSPGRPYFPFFFMLNASKPPLNDKRVRQAIAWALDRTEIVKLVYFGSHVVTAEPTPEPSPWSTGVNAQKGGPDIARARQLMADAGAAG